MSLLLENGASAGLLDQTSTSALHCAVTANRPPAVTLLVKKRAPLKSQPLLFPFRHT